MKLPVIKKTKTGYSTDAEVLEKLSVYHKIPKKVLEYRQLAKLKSTYIDGLINMVNKKTGRIHTTFNQTITATGRLTVLNRIYRIYLYGMNWAERSERLLFHLKGAGC